MLFPPALPGDSSGRRSLRVFLSQRRLAGGRGSAALAELDRIYVRTDQTFDDEFRQDQIPVAQLKKLIEQAFAGVTRGDGVTLHQAIAKDDYATDDAIAAAAQQDKDQDWRDVPADPQASSEVIFSYLDPRGLRYYLPAAMVLSLDPVRRAQSETPTRTYWAFLPVVAPRDRGKGLGEAFDVEAFVKAIGFTQDQVVAIYRFLCFMAVEGGEGVEEEYLPALRRWRDLALKRS